MIGNGPSLKMSDLNLLQNEVCLASNKIYLAFNETHWRPSHYTICDDILWKKIRKNISSYFSSVSSPWDFASQSGLIHRHFQHLPWNLEAPVDGSAFSLNVSKGLYGGYTVTYTNLQIAAHMGLDPIYLLGCDHFYKGECQGGDDAPIVTVTTQNHFNEAYREVGELVRPAPISKMEKAYSHAREIHERGIVQIFNATRGGELDIFERVDFDRLW